MNTFLKLLTILLSILIIIPLTLGIELFIVFLILKLCNVITWPWICICIPIIAWGCSLVLYIIIYGIYGD